MHRFGRHDELESTIHFGVCFDKPSRMVALGAVNTFAPGIPLPFESMTCPSIEPNFISAFDCKLAALAIAAKAANQNLVHTWSLSPYGRMIGPHLRILLYHGQHRSNETTPSRCARSRRLFPSHKPGRKSHNSSVCLLRARCTTTLTSTQEACHKTLSLLRSERRRLSGSPGRRARLLANR